MKITKIFNFRGFTHLRDFMHKDKIILAQMKKSYFLDQRNQFLRKGIIIFS